MIWRLQTLDKLDKAMPGQDYLSLQEMVQADLMPANPNWENEEPLNEEEQALLEEFVRRSRPEG